MTTVQTCDRCGCCAEMPYQELFDGQEVVTLCCDCAEQPAERRDPATWLSVVVLVTISVTALCVLASALLL